MAKMTTSGIKAVAANYVVAAKQAGVWSSTTHNMYGAIDKIGKMVNNTSTEDRQWQGEGCAREQDAQRSAVILCACLGGDIFRDGCLDPGGSEGKGQRHHGRDQLIDSHSLLSEGLREKCSVEKTDQSAGKACECQEQRTGDQWIAFEGKRSVPFSLINSVHGFVSGTYF